MTPWRRYSRAITPSSGNSPTYEASGKIFRMAQRRLSNSSLFVVSLVLLGPGGCATPIPGKRVSEEVQMPVPAGKGAVKELEADLGHLFDAIAERYGLVCQICEPLSEGRSYSGQIDAESALALTVNFDPERGRIYYDVQARAGDPQARQDADAVRLEIKAELEASFQELQTAPLPPRRTESVWLRVEKARHAASYLSPENQDAYRRALSIIDRVATGYGLAQAHPAMYYAGKLLGPDEYERELTLSAAIGNDPLINIRIDCRSGDHAELQRQIAGELARQLKAEFGERRVSSR